MPPSNPEPAAAGFPPMNLIAGMRRVSAWVRRRLVPGGPVPKKSALAQGLPPGLERAYLEDVCREHLGSSLQKISYQHLSGWKSHGAFRLFLRLNGGQQRSLIYKNAHYNLTEIPALQDFPAHPGPPEYVIYRLVLEYPGSRFASYLPETYRADEIEPGRLYRFLFEDIGEDYSRVDTALMRLPVAPQLPALQSALQELLPEPPDPALIQYDPQYSRLLRSYARINLERYHQQTDSAKALLGEVISRWAEIEDVHEAGLDRASSCTGPIHGDLNFANVYVRKDNGSRFKALDWEWAGYGPVLMDLAALMKGCQREQLEQALQSFLHTDKRAGGLAEPRRLFYWCMLERSLNDAAYLAAQEMDGSIKARFSLPRIINNSLRRLLDATQQL